MADIGDAIGLFGGAVSDLFGAKGSQQAASAYKTAASIAQKNEALTRRSTAIQTQQQDILTFKTLGAEQADTAAAGFSTTGGSAGDLLRASGQQAALSKQLIENQGEITAQGYEQQAQAYLGQASAANTQSKGQGIGGILGAAAGVFSLFSDRRLKRNIKFIRKDGQFNIYQFQYINHPETWEGVMADEVLAIRPEAVITLCGYMAVNYDMIGVQMKEITNA